MKKVIILVLFAMTGVPSVHAQHIVPNEQQRKDIHSLIDQYSQAREKMDTILLKSILTNDIDQLVSTGEWRDGMRAAMKGMQNSSSSSPGTRKLIIEKIRLINPNSAIVDCRYEIQNTTGNTRKMWSTFIIISDNGTWKITGIRNMLPSRQ